MECPKFSITSFILGGAAGLLLWLFWPADFENLSDRYKEKLRELHPSGTPFVGRARACAAEFSENCRDVILVRSDIELGRTKSMLFTELARELNSRIDTVCFDTQGGSVDEAKILIDLIKARKLNTCLAAHYKVEDKPDSPVQTTLCNSVCPLIFLAGLNRYAIGDEFLIGVHQIFYSNKKNGGDVEANTKAVFKDIFGDVGNESVRELMGVYLKSHYFGMKYLTDSEICRFGFFTSHVY